MLGIQTGINVVGALIYPTSLRSNGSGWQLGIGRIGSVVLELVRSSSGSDSVVDAYLIACFGDPAVDRPAS